ncbi:MAG: hypothetical protein LLG04_16925 [Parachlamydia sp.]|nr:hypothetical protein [Parachlamydia sp.]
MNQELQYVGNTPTSGYSFLFCNGIENTAEQAEQSAQLISEALGGRIVTLLHNSTTLSQFAQAHHDQESTRQHDVAQKITGFIRGQIQGHLDKKISKDQIKIYLFVHSHGAVLTELALNILGEDEKSRVVVFSYGGAKRLEKKVAGAVNNYLNKNDKVAPLGWNLTMSGSEFVTVADLEEIFTSDSHEERLKTAAGKCENETILRENYLTMQGKPTKYEKVWNQKDPVAIVCHPYFQKRWALYEELIKSYNIKILNPECDKSTGLAQVLDSHSFESYMPQVRLDAAKVISRIQKELANS